MSVPTSRSLYTVPREHERMNSSHESQSVAWCKGIAATSEYSYTDTIKHRPTVPMGKLNVLEMYCLDLGQVPCSSRRSQLQMHVSTLLPDHYFPPATFSQIAILGTQSQGSRMMPTDLVAQQPTESGCPEDGGTEADPEELARLSGGHCRADEMLVSDPALGNVSPLSAGEEVKPRNAGHRRQSVTVTGRRLLPKSVTCLQPGSVKIEGKSPLHLGMKRWSNRILLPFQKRPCPLPQVQAFPRRNPCAR
ncbi:T-complex protein 10A1 [Manis javanica]|nr:T-complex protein 10A1 [Manis javanica]